MRSQISSGLESGRQQGTSGGWTSTAVRSWLGQLASSVGWWVLSLGIVVIMWELAVALQFVNPVILPPPHLFLAEIRIQAQFLMPQVGAAASSGNFIVLTVIWMSLQRVLLGLLLAFVIAVTLGSLAIVGVEQGLLHVQPRDLLLGTGGYGHGEPERNGQCDFTLHF